MATPVENSSIKTVTSWTSPELYAKGNGLIIATALRALTLSIVNPFYKETWDEIVGDETIRYSMSRLDVLKNFGWVALDKLLHKKKALTIISTPEALPSEEKEQIIEEAPLDYLLPLLDSNNNSPKIPPHEENDHLLYLCFDDEKAKDAPKQTLIEDGDFLSYLMDPLKETSPKSIQLSDEDVVNALFYLAEVPQEKGSEPIKVKECKDLSDSLLEMIK